jgi:hypothetical protein
MRYFDIAGLPISLEYWAILFEDTEYRTVGRWENDEILISTVWMGLDAGHGLIFETMVFSAEGEVIQSRYRTFEEAQRGHIETVHAVTGLITEIDS